MTDPYSPPPELVEAAARSLCESDGMDWDEARDEGDPDVGTTALAYAVAAEDVLTAAVAYRTPEGDPELVPWEQVRELVYAADNAHRALGVVLSIPSESGGILGAQSVASHAQGVLRAALAPFTQEPQP